MNGGGCRSAPSSNPKDSSTAFDKVVRRERFRCEVGRGVCRVETVPITEANPFKGRQYPGQVIVTAVRWYLRYPLAYEHVSELLSERGLPVDASCVWRRVQAFAPELSKRCRRGRI